MTRADIQDAPEPFRSENWDMFGIWQAGVSDP